MNLDAFQRKDIRRQIDEVHGLAKLKGARRGDFKMCRESDKVLKDYRRFPKDHKKIEKKYFEVQKSFRKGGL